MTKEKANLAPTISKEKLERKGGVLGVFVGLLTVVLSELEWPSR